MPSALPPPVQFPVLENSGKIAETFTPSEMGENRVTRSEKTLGLRSRQLSEGKEGIRMQRQLLTTSCKETEATPVPSKGHLGTHPLFCSSCAPVFVAILYSITFFPPWDSAQYSAHPGYCLGAVAALSSNSQNTALFSTFISPNPQIQSTELRAAMLKLTQSQLMS